MDWSAKAQDIRAVVLDVDGVLTDGRIGYGGGSDDEIKFFHVRDGVGIALLRQSGVKVGIITGRCSKANRRRAEELKLDFVFEGQLRKSDALLALCEQLGLQPAHCLYVGDDVIDIGPMRLAGVAVAVGDAAAEAKAGITVTDNSLINLLLAVLGLSIVAMLIMQSQLNAIADKQ